MEFLKQIPNSKTFPYWVAAAAFACAGYAFFGWVDTERRCAERESEIMAQTRVQIQEVVRDCEEQKKEAQRRLEAFVLESSKRYTDLARQVYNRRK